MNNSQLRRMWVVAAALVLGTFIVVGRLFAFQITQGEEFAKEKVDTAPVVDQPERGVIYDRNGAILAVDQLDYSVGVSPTLVSDPEELANALAPILQISRGQLLDEIESPKMYVQLAQRVTSDVADAIRASDFADEVQLDPLPRRFYPQDELMCHVLGYVSWANEGGAGVEGAYQEELAGEKASADVAISPLREQPSVIAREGSDLVLTIDRSVQYVVEQHLQQALAEHGAVSGEILVMDPRTGELLAMAASPCYSPNRFNEYPPEASYNPLVSAAHEPGSVMKLITMAAALDSGVVTPESTYNDTGAIEVGGHISYNWDRGAHGVVDMTTLLARSLNVGAATLAVRMGELTFYDYFQRFGFGHTTGIDIQAEETGIMYLPGDQYWAISNLATNSYGQGLAVTPLQMISAVSVLANGGRLMQPHVVAEIHDDLGVRVIEPKVQSQVISPNTAAQMTTMATIAVQQEVPEAMVEGYTVAGKTGTAQIPEPIVGYHPTDVIGSFIGWLPADDPQILIFVKLDRPKSAPWGSMTAAPVFAKLANELVVLLDIPPDAVRLQANNISAGGG